jgi:hypothetical protein
MRTESEYRNPLRSLTGALLADARVCAVLWSDFLLCRAGVSTPTHYSILLIVIGLGSDMHEMIHYKVYSSLIIARSYLSLC